MCLLPCNPSLLSCCVFSLLQVIKRFIMHAKKTAFIVEHDFIMATYLADRVIVYEGEASKSATARTPTSLQQGAWAAVK
jgi:translation initiation factor RLI1